MKIAIDGLIFRSEYLKRGIGKFSLTLLKSLLENDKNNEYYLFNYFPFDFVFSDKNYKNITCVNCFVGDENILKINNYLYGDITCRMIEKYNIDQIIIFCPYNGIIKEYKMEWFLNCKTSAILYDAIPYIMKNKYFTSENELKNYLTLTKSISKFEQFFSISNTTTNDFVKLFNFDKTKITNIYTSIDLSKFKKNTDSNIKNNIFNKYGIKKRYLIYVSGEDYRKNNINTIKAFEKANNENCQLLIIGKLNTELFIKLTNEINKTNLNKKILLLNYISDEELSCLYENAIGVIFPSLYEGFGLPILEAFYYNLPLLTSNNSSMKEIAENAAILVNPYSIEDLAKGINTIIDKKYNEEMILNGTKILKKFSFHNTGLTLIKKLSPLKQINRINKIAIFTPLPPIKSGISDYSVQLINRLSENIHVDVYIDKGYKPSINFNSNVQIYIYKKFKTNKNYDAIIYQFGASLYHIYMIPFLKRYKGIIEMHDGLYIYLYGEIIKHKKYRSILFSADNKIFKSKDYLFNFLINSSDSIIVHNNYLKKKILNNYIKKIKCIPLLTNTTSNNLTKTEARKQLNISSDTIVFGSFGFIQDTKRSKEELIAFNNFLKRNASLKAMYIFVGEPDSKTKNYLNEYIKTHSLQKKVLITGFLNEQEFELYFKSVDLNFNLRFPYNGESSSTLVKSMYLKVPVVINSEEIFDENGLFYVISNKNIIKSIEDAMIAYLKNPNYFTDLSNKAFLYFTKILNEKHIIDNYINFISNKRRFNLSVEDLTKFSYLHNEKKKLLIKPLSEIISFD